MCVYNYDLMNDNKQHEELKSDQKNSPPTDEKLAQHFILWKQDRETSYRTDNTL